VIGRLATSMCVLLAATACSKEPPATPSTGSPSGPITIRGNERLAWDQQAAETAELSKIGYILYIDGSQGRVLLSGVGCATTAGPSGFECRAPIPPLGAGPHTLELTAFFQDSPSQESGRSNALQVSMGETLAVVAEPAAPVRAAGARATSEEQSQWPSRASLLVDALDNPSDVAFTPDGRLWIAEAPGRVRVARDGVLASEPALALPSAADGTGGLLAIAVDPNFTRTGFIYAIYTSRSRAGGMAFTIARFREAGGTLADRIVLLDEVPASSDAHASLRFGPDGKLYAAFDTGVAPHDARLADDPASFNGKILRLNRDGTTPDDAARKSPILIGGLLSPRGLAWPQSTGRLWAADTMRVGDVSWTPEPTALAAGLDDLFIASALGVVRAHIDPRNPVRFAATGTLMSGVPVRAVTIGPDGALYFATTEAVGRLDLSKMADKASAPMKRH
jgi:glucose/arabinose dehydrogenase